jgi:hypothetical protein
MHGRVWKKKGELTRLAWTRRVARGMKLRDDRGSGGVLDFAAYFVAHLVVNGRQVVLLTAMLFGHLQDFVWTGPFGFPGTCGKAGIGAAE